MFSTQMYRDYFGRFLENGEVTRGDEVLVDMEEPMGEKITQIGIKHRFAMCKAFVATTNMGRLLMVLFDDWGTFHKCYQIPLKKIRKLYFKKEFGGTAISFVIPTPQGDREIELRVLNRIMGTDLKEQKQHKELLIEHLNTIHMPQKVVADADRAGYEPAKQEENESQSAPMKQETEYPISEFIARAPILKDVFGTFYEPFGVRAVSYQGKEYALYAEDKGCGTVLICTGRQDSLKDGFVHEGYGGGTCKKIGTYPYLQAGQYYKEVKVAELDSIFHRQVYAVYKRCRVDVSLKPDRVKLIYSYNQYNGQEARDQDIMLKALGFKEKYIPDDYTDNRDRWEYTLEDVPYNDPDLKLYIHKKYLIGDKKEETVEFFPLG